MRKNPNDFLRKAKKNKNDEFYTQLKDIEQELQYYQGQFQDKVVYCNCDYPCRSNFYRYFAENFHRLGLKQLIASCYLEDDLAETAASYYIYSGKEDEAMIPSLKDLLYFSGNGDFRSQESIELLKKADLVVTNPPFSLFREHLAQIVRYQKGFLLIANINAITYKDVFGLIKDNKAWLGVHMGRGISGFIVPSSYQLYGTEARIDEDGNRIVSTNNNLWLTNLDVYKRHLDLPLTKNYLGNEANYPQYDNYEGINVNRTKDIPQDYPGAMGVPITFLHKFNPEQFEIIRFRKGLDNKDLSINGRQPYFRILIRNKKTLV